MLIAFSNSLELQINLHDTLNNDFFDCFSITSSKALALQSFSGGGTKRFLGSTLDLLY